MSSIPTSIRFIRSINALAGRLAPGLAARTARKMLMTPRRQTVREWEKEFMLSANRITLGNGLSALHWGQSGPLVVCLHGWEGRATQFSAMVNPLLLAGYQVLSLDAPAHGQSPGKEANPLVFMQALLDIENELNERFGPLAILIGHSMGAGAAALAISRGLKTQSAVLIAAPSGLRNVLQRFADFVGLPPAAQDRFFRIVEEHTRAPLHTVQVSELASHFNIPGLIIHDQDDVVVPFVEAGEIARNWPRAKLLATTGLGHNRVLRDVNVISTVVSFARFALPYRKAA